MFSNGHIEGVRAFETESDSYVGGCIHKRLVHWDKINRTKRV